MRLKALVEKKRAPRKAPAVTCAFAVLVRVRLGGPVLPLHGSSKYCPMSCRTVAAPPARLQSPDRQAPHRSTAPRQQSAC